MATYKYKETSSIRVSVSSQLTPAVHEKLGAAARELNMSKSGLVSRIVSDYVNKDDKTKVECEIRNAAMVETPQRNKYDNSDNRVPRGQGKGFDTFSKLLKAHSVEVCLKGAAEILGVSIYHIETLRKAGVLKPCRVTDTQKCRAYYLRSDLEALKKEISE